MKNKIRFLFPIILLAFLFIPKAFAGSYDCTVVYPGSDSTNPFTYDSCSYPQGGDTEPYQGISCRPEGEILRTGSVTSCVTKQSILDLATSARGQNRAGFNSFTGSISSSCRASYCKPSGSNVCEALTGNTCPVALNRQLVCPGGCGGCSEGYVYCVDDQPTGLLNELNPVVGTTPACQLEKDGSTFPANGGVSCADMGREVLNPCTGECTDCPAGKTPSGRTPNICINFAQRFLEIFADGFTSLGGKFINVGGVELAHVYSYGSITDLVDWENTQTDNPAFYGTVFTEVDQADHLNWASPSVPDVIQNMLTTNNYVLCDDVEDCEAGQVCTAGICNNPGSDGEEGDACTTSSGCNLGLVCDLGTNTCVDLNDPNNTLTECSENDDCLGLGANYSCVNGYCHDQSNSAGDACVNDSSCAAGLMCVDLICVYNNLFVPISYFMDVSANSTGDVAGGEGYKSADALCDPTVVANSHVCTAEEVINAYVMDADTLTGKSGLAWINNGPPGYVKYVTNDCNGWTTNTSTIFGSVWSFDADASFITPCNQNIPFACCK
ncbi:hypothetical protein KKA33_02130 [Patescibacteria group bacterium]|nr:hypothetical protein [Patescibacteria group bacterium]